MDVAALAALAGNALVQAVVTDGWEGVRRRVARFFGRGQPDPKAEQKIDATRAQLAAAAPDELAQAQADLARDWAVRFKDLLAEDPAAAAELATLVEEIRASLPMAVSDHSVGAGRDVNVTAEGGSVAAGVIHGDVGMPGPRAPGPVGGEPGPG